jgi:hypothetical protein
MISFLIPILKAFAKFICPIHTTQEMLDVFSLFVISEVFFNLTSDSSSVLFIVNLSAPRRPPSQGFLLVCLLCVTCQVSVGKSSFAGWWEMPGDTVDSGTPVQGVN